MKATLEGKSGTSTLSLAHLSFRQLISDFNENRKQNVAASTSQEGIQRVHECLLATDYEIWQLASSDQSLSQAETYRDGVNTANTKAGLVLHLEIQKGKEAMCEMKHGHEYGGTAVCCLRMITATANSKMSIVPTSSTVTLGSGVSSVSGRSRSGGVTTLFSSSRRGKQRVRGRYSKRP